MITNTPAELLPPPAIAPGKQAAYKVLTIALGIIVPLLVAGIFSNKGLFAIPGASAYVGYLPAFNALLNSATAVALVLGLYFIRQQNVVAHRAAMGTAFAFGAVFLLSYVAYHTQAEQTFYGGYGAARIVYFFLLITHIALAIVTVALVLVTLYFSLTGQYTKHKRIARWTFPVWLYVSVTGVIVYFMISPYYK